MKRSLLLKTYVYAAVAFVLSLVLLFGVGQLFVGMHEYRVARADDVPVVAFIKHDLERERSQQELAALGRATLRQLSFVAWGDPRIPAGLRTSAILEGQRDPEGAPSWWARLEVKGRPVGAVLVRPINAMSMPEAREGAFVEAGIGASAAVRTGVQRKGPGERQLGVETGPNLPLLALLWALLVFLMVVPPIWLWVIRPLKSMEAAARRLGQGDLETPVALGHRDEFGTLERTLEQSRLRLREAIAQKERLLTDVSHEVRGPLARMLMALPLMRQEGASGPMTDMFEQELETAERMLTDVLRLARAEAPLGASEPVDLAVLAGELVAVRRATDTRLSASLEPAWVRGDARQLAIALRNLLDNALAYTGPEGQVRVVTGETGGQAFARVEDDGPGIATEHLPHLFEPFYRCDTSRSRETGGAGLGLSIVKRVAEGHGGTARLDSREGAGTTATLTFPRDARPRGSW